MEKNKVDAIASEVAGGRFSPRGEFLKWFSFKKIKNEINAPVRKCESFHMRYRDGRLSLRFENGRSIYF